MSNFSIQERINQELDKISQAIQQLEMFLKQLTNQPFAIYQEALVNSIALNLHGIYTGIERLFQVIAKEIDLRVPTGDKWHRDLLGELDIKNHPMIRQHPKRYQRTISRDQAVPPALDLTSVEPELQTCPFL